MKREVTNQRQAELAVTPFRCGLLLHTGLFRLWQYRNKGSPAVPPPVCWLRGQEAVGLCVNVEGGVCKGIRSRWAVMAHGECGVSK